MKARHALLLAAVSSIGAAGLVHGIQAQPKPPVYYVAELEVLNPDALKPRSKRRAGAIWYAEPTSRDWKVLHPGRWSSSPGTT